MSSLCALCYVPSVKKQKRDFNFFHSMYNKTMIRFSFCDIVLDITKTSSTKCLLVATWIISLGYPQNLMAFLIIIYSLMDKNCSSCS